MRRSRQVDFARDLYEEDSDEQLLGNCDIDGAAHDQDQDVQLQSSTLNEIQPLKCSNPVVDRLSLLPAYPTFDREGPVSREHLLLANVSPEELTIEQRRRRTHHAFHQPFTVIDQSNDISVRPFFVNVYHRLYQDLKQRFHVDDAILDYNYERLRTCMGIMARERIRYGFLSPNTIDVEELRLVEYTLAMEFYLQTNDELFFMKTCSFRNAQPTSYNHQGIFCVGAARAHYGIEPCENLGCRFCFPIKDILLRGRQDQPVIRFASAQKHRFVNGYEAILNCPASCATSNILYALTCPCGQVDYIGYTLNTLDQQLKYHREHGSRIMHEFLLGSQNVTGQTQQQQSKSTEELAASKMLLYTHSTRCPMAIQMFLDCNPQYWCLVPTQRVEAQGLSEELPTPSQSFSAYQRAKQLQACRDQYDRLKPNYHLDLYDAAIVVVLPEKCTEMFYRFIEALFITHAQTKLNTLGHLDGLIVGNNNSNDTNARMVTGWRDDNWWQGLIRRPTMAHEQRKGFMTSRRVHAHFQ